ncbi:MAG: hypothetical protein DDT32_01932 [Syntrophomonadaceae bacterium]|nr:hypothetical protein [Bacillota bacterium]
MGEVPFVRLNCAKGRNPEARILQALQAVYRGINRATKQVWGTSKEDQEDHALTGVVVDIAFGV